jgi:hypothetical protein
VPSGMDLNSSILTDSINDFVPITSNINSSVSSQIDSAVDLDIQQQKQTSKNNVVASSFITPIESLNQISSVLISDGHSLNTANSLPVIKPNHQISNAPSKSVASNLINQKQQNVNKSLAVSSGIQQMQGQINSVFSSNIHSCLTTPTSILSKQTMLSSHFNNSATVTVSNLIKQKQQTTLNNSNLGIPQFRKKNCLLIETSDYDLFNESKTHKVKLNKASVPVTVDTGLGLGRFGSNAIKSTNGLKNSCLNNNLIKQRHQKNFLNNLLASPVSSDEVYTDPYDPDINANLSVRQQVQPCTKINFVLNSNSDSLTNTPIIKTFHQISNAPSKSVASNLINQKQQNVNKSLAVSSGIQQMQSQINPIFCSNIHSCLNTPTSILSKQTTLPSHLNTPSKSVASNLINQKQQNVNKSLAVSSGIQQMQSQINPIFCSNIHSCLNTPTSILSKQTTLPSHLNTPSKSVASNLINQKQQNVNKSLAASSFITPIESLNQISSVLISDGHSLRTPISLPFSKPNFQIYNISPTPRVSNSINQKQQLANLDIPLFRKKISNLTITSPVKQKLVNLMSSPSGFSSLPINNNNLSPNFNSTLISNSLPPPPPLINSSLSSISHQSANNRPLQPQPHYILPNENSLNPRRVGIYKSKGCCNENVVFYSKTNHYFYITNGVHRKIKTDCVYDENNILIKMSDFLATYYFLQDHDNIERLKLKLFSFIFYFIILLNLKLDKLE